MIKFWKTPTCPLKKKKIKRGKKTGVSISKLNWFYMTFQD